MKTKSEKTKFGWTIPKEKSIEQIVMEYGTKESETPHAGIPAGQWSVSAASAEGDIQIGRADGLTVGAAYGTPLHRELMARLLADKTVAELPAVLQGALEDICKDALRKYFSVEFVDGSSIDRSAEAPAWGHEDDEHTPGFGEANHEPAAVKPENLFEEFGERPQPNPELERLFFNDGTLPPTDGKPAKGCGDKAKNSVRHAIRHWNELEAKLLQELNGPSYTLAEAAEAIGRSRKAVLCRLERTGCKPAFKLRGHGGSLRWTEEEVARLKELNDAGAKIGDAVSALGRSASAIGNKLDALGIPSNLSKGCSGPGAPKPGAGWTPAETKLLLPHLKDYCAEIGERLSARLGRSAHAIKSKIARLRGKK